MLTAKEHASAVATAIEIEATLYWKQAEAEAAYESGRISKAQFDDVTRLHAKAEKNLWSIHDKPYIYTTSNGEEIIMHAGKQG